MDPKETGRPSQVDMEQWVRELVQRHGDEADWYSFCGIIEDRDRLAAELLAVREELVILREIAHISRPRVRNTDMTALCAAIRRLDALSQPTKTGGG